MGLGIKTKQAIQDAVDDQREFKIGNVSGESMLGVGDIKYGRLGDPYHTQLQRLFEARIVSYIIYSYGTPIAWMTHNGTWVVPEHSYSSTTTHHQNVVKEAINKYNYWYTIGSHA